MAQRPFRAWSQTLGFSGRATIREGRPASRATAPVASSTPAPDAVLETLEAPARARGNCLFHRHGRGKSRVMTVFVYVTGDLQARCHP